MAFFCVFAFMCVCGSCRTGIERALYMCVVGFVLYGCDRKAICFANFFCVL